MKYKFWDRKIKWSLREDLYIFITIISNDPIIVISKNKFLVYNKNEIVGKFIT